MPAPAKTRITERRPIATAAETATSPARTGAALSTEAIPSNAHEAFRAVSNARRFVGFTRADIDGERFGKLGSALGLLIFLTDRQTSASGDVYYHREISYSWMRALFPNAPRARTLRSWMAKLRKHGEAEVQPTPNGMRVRLLRSDKWRRQLALFPPPKPTPITWRTRNPQAAKSQTETSRQKGTGPANICPGVRQDLADKSSKNKTGETGNTWAAQNAASSSPPCLDSKPKNLTAPRLRYRAIARLADQAVPILTRAGKSRSDAEVSEQLKQWAATNDVLYDSDAIAKAELIAEERIRGSGVVPIAVKSSAAGQRTCPQAPPSGRDRRKDEATTRTVNEIKRITEAYVGADDEGIARRDQRLAPLYRQLARLQQGNPSAAPMQIKEFGRPKPTAESPEERSHGSPKIPSPSQLSVPKCTATTPMNRETTREMTLDELLTGVRNARAKMGLST